MRRFYAISACLFVFASLFLGCTRQPAKNPDDDKQNAQIDPNKIKIAPPKQEKNQNGEPAVKPSDDKQQKYEAALGDALAALADRKWADALTAFELAKTFDNTEFVQAEIARLKGLLDQNVAAKTTLKNIETVLNDGKPDEAIKLANEALKEFGDGDDAAELVKLRLQAEALQGVDKKEDADARFERFRKEAETALTDKNLRAAALAYEQALQARADADLQTKYEGIRGRLDKYDALRKKAAELRGDPTQLDDALAALKEAAAAWETIQVRNEIDEIELAMQKERGTVSVANFELRNDVGMADAGAALAEEILPLLKPKYDIVERAQLNQVLGELKLQRNFADDPKQQQQIGKLAKVRYLVVGNVSRLVGVTVRARLIDVQTGLVVQTGKIIAPTIKDAIDLAPELAKQLLMTDDAKMQFEQQVAQNAAKPAEPAPENAPIPPAPLAPAADAPPPPPMLNVAPPAVGNVQADAFKVLAPPPQDFVAPQIDPLQLQQRNRLLFATLELGDFFFRAGRFGEAQRQYEFALMLAPDNFDIQLRLQRVLPFAPPVPTFAPRPRIAFLPFGVYGDPFVVPPSLGYWTPANLSPYFAWQYEVVDPSEIYWYMGRMGLTMNDLLVNPNARRWLGRAVGVRYFVLGTIVRTDSFNVFTYLIDAELGYLQGAATIHVRDPYELKLRLPELAQLTMMSPVGQAAYLADDEQQRFDRLVFDGRRHMDQRRYREALREFDLALELRPFNVQVRVWQNQCQAQVRFQDFLLARSRNGAGLQIMVTTARQRQLDLAHSSEMARRRAVALAASRSDADRQAHVALQVRAQSSLITQAQFALKTKNFSISVNLFRGAMDLGPPAAVGVVSPAQAVIYRDFAQARLEADRAAQARNAQLTAVREATLRKVREQQLADAQQALATERIGATKARDALLLAQTKRDDAAFTAGLNQGTAYMTQNKYEAALAAFQGAQRVAHTTQQRERVNNFIDIIVQRQATAGATTNDEKTAIERKLLLERERRKTADSLAKQNEQTYQVALQNAQNALAAKNYEIAQSKFEEAGKLYRTDAVLRGLKQIDDARAALLAEQKKTQAEAKKGETIKQLLSTGNAALEAKKFADAVQAFQQAKKLAPDDLDAIAGLTRAEQARDRLLADARRKTDDANQEQNFQRLVKSGRANLAAKQYEAAVANLSEAVNLNPTDASVRADLRQAETARDATLSDPNAQAAAKKRAADYQKLLTAGQLALDGKRYADAIKAFGDAQKLLPGDKASQDYLQEAQTAQKAAEDAVARSVKQKTLDGTKNANLQKALTQARAALAADNLAAAATALAQAKAIDAKDADVVQIDRALEQAQQRAATQTLAQKKRLQELTQLIATGQAALKVKDYDAAEKALRSASQVDPTNPAIAQGLKEIETGRKALGDSKQRLADYQTAVLAGQKALQGKNYAAAIQSFQQALKFFPDDANASKLLRQAQLEMTNAGKTQENFDLAMTAGQKAMTAKNYSGAVKSFTDATKLMPTDLRARQLLLQAQQALTNANQQAAAQASYQKAMTAGQTALKAKRYSDAVKAFGDAAKLFPNDPTAAQQLRQAQQLLTDSTKTKTPPAVDKTKQLFDQAMNRGAAAEKDQRYSDAVKAFQEALKARPKDADAQAGVNNNQFSLHLQQGQQYLNNMMWVNAQNEFQAALRIFPKNAQAQKLLQKAKSKMK